MTRCLIILKVSILYLFALSLSAQTLPSEIQLTVFIVRETEACAPKGYSNYNSRTDPGERKCSPLSFGQKECWQGKRVPNRAFKLPTELNEVNVVKDLNLGNDLLPVLNAIGTQPVSLNPKERHAAVFFFDFGRRFENSVEFTREGSDGIPQITRKYKLSGEQRWITHCRADSLVPTRYVKWTIKVPGMVSQFKFVP